MSTGIQWTDETWNPLLAFGGPMTGSGIGWHCERVSPGCVNCYAEALNAAQRFGRGTGLAYNRPARDEVSVFLEEKTLEAPMHWRKPRRVFVCSMTDLFGEWVTDEMLDRVFAVMALTPQHTYQVLTKRPERMHAYLNDAFHRPAAVVNAAYFHVLDRLPSFKEGQAVVDYWDGKLPLRNVWLGVSVEDQQRADERIPVLLGTPAAVRFLSCEPLLSMVELTHYLSNEANDVTSRERVPSTDRSRDVLGGYRGAGVATPENEQWERPEGSTVVPCDSADTSGERGNAGVPAPAVHHGRGSSSGLRPPDRLDGDKSLGHSAANGGQPHRRGSVEQPPVESRSDHQGGERGSRPLHAWQDRPSESPRGEVDSSTSGRDSSTLRCEGPASDGNRQAVRGFGEDGRQYRPAEDLQGDSRLEHIDWVIVGGESGPGARPCDVGWIRSLVAQCRAAGVPAFVKQLGAKPRHMDPAQSSTFTSALKLRHSHGGDPDEWPEDLRIREFPR